MLLKRLIALCVLLAAPFAAMAQVGIKGQVFLPNGEPLRRQVRFTLITDDQLRREYFYTDANGRIALPQIRGPYTLVFETDGEMYDTTRASFTPPHSGPYVLVYLKALKAAASHPPGVVEVEQEVSKKAKEAYKQAADFIFAQNYEKAIEALKRAIAAQPDYFRAHNDLGVAYMKLKRLDEAAESFRQAIKINSRVYLPQFNLGLVLNLQGKYKGAIEVLSLVHRDHPEMAVIHLTLIEALLGAQDWRRSEEELMKAASHKGVNAVEIKIKLGMVRMKQGKHPAAVEALTEAVSAEPDNELAQLNLGMALHQTGDLDKAEATLIKAYQIGGARVASAQLVLGMLYHQKGNFPKAIESFETFLRDFPDAPNTAQVKESIQQLKQAITKK